LQLMPSGVTQAGEQRRHTLGTFQFGKPATWHVLLNPCHHPRVRACIPTLLTPSHTSHSHTLPLTRHVTLAGRYAARRRRLHGKPSGGTCDGGGRHALPCQMLPTLNPWLVVHFIRGLLHTAVSPLEASLQAGSQLHEREICSLTRNAFREPAILTDGAARFGNAAFAHEVDCSAG
jgi:hypothetical protein